MYDFSSNEDGKIEHFFNCSTRAPILDGVIHFLKTKNDSLDFVPRFIEKYGMPVWDNAVYLEDDCKYLLVPFKNPSKKEIEGIWTFKIENNNYIHSFPVIKQKTIERDYWTFDYFTCDVLKKKPKSGLMFEDVMKTKAGLPEYKCIRSRVEVELNGRIVYGDWKTHCWNDTENFSLYGDDRNSMMSDFKLDDIRGAGGYIGGNGDGGGGVFPQPAETDNSPKIIKDTTFVDSKADCIFEKMRMQSPDFKKSIQKFDGDFPVAHLKFSLAALDGLNGEAIPPKNYVIGINIDKSSLDNRPNLDIARTFAHEVIHAEIYRKLLSLAQQGRLIDKEMDSSEKNTKYVESMRDNFPGLFDYYAVRQITSGEEILAAHYRSAIISILKQFDPNQPEELYEALSWGGLRGTVSWKALDEKKKSNLNAKVSNFLKKGGEECK